LHRNIGFEEKRQFFCQKLAKIAGKWDQNIDPRLRQNKWKTDLSICLNYETNCGLFQITFSVLQHFGGKKT
jgi:hypothetical protein